MELLVQSCKVNTIVITGYREVFEGNTLSPTIIKYAERQVKSWREFAS